MGKSAKLVISTVSDRRGHARRAIRLMIDCEWGAGRQRAFVRNISSTGLLIEADQALRVGDAATVELPGYTASARVVWTSGRFSGCTFDEALPAAAVSAAALKSEFERSELETAGPDDEVAKPSLSTPTKVKILVLLSTALWAAIIFLVWRFF